MTPTPEIVDIVGQLRTLFIGVLGSAAFVQIAHTNYDLIARGASQLR